MTRYQALTVTTVVATLVLIGVGSVVRTTGSGLGCPDWPLCHGALLPPLERTAIIEYTHRTVAAVVGLLIVVQALWTLRRYPQDRALRTLAVASLPLLALQAWLGKVTVERELPPEVVSFHLSTALILFAVLAMIAAFALQGPNRERIETPERRGLRRVALGAGVVTAGVMIVGTYLVGTDAGFACTGWPNCPEARIPFVDGGRLQDIHWLHRITVLGGLAAVALVLFHVSQMRQAGPALQRGAQALVALYALQILVGAGNIWSDFAEAVRVAHLVVGASIWALLVVIAFAGQYRPDPREEEQPAPAPRAETSGARA